ncbi:MAG: MBL fold metallo-hydrolase [Candidatus Omnitrophota bacterium]
MILKRFIVGPLETNCYLVADAVSKEALLIDPGGDAGGAITDFILKNGLIVKYVVNTHGHGDHIAANGVFKADILIHGNDRACLTDPRLNLSTVYGAGVVSPDAARSLADGDEIKAGDLLFQVLHTPGHTPGCICLKHDNILFSGDTLFFECVGRTDLPSGSHRAIQESIKNRLMNLPDDCKVHPGHGRETTIGHERRNNPFLR